MAKTDPAILKLAKARVAGGEAFLDVLKPGWWKKIDLKKLDIADGYDCVVGQLLGNWMLGVLGLSSQDAAAALGFTAGRGDPGWVDFDVLTRRWKRVIRARQAAGA